MEKFVTGIKRKYRERLINREKQWPPCHTNKLIQLQLVEREKGEDYSTNQLRGREDKTVKRTPLAYGDLLMVESGKKPVRKVLVEGDAGIGKTTLCTSVSEDWADEKIFQQFELLLLLPLRQKEVASAGSLPELFKLLHSSESICNSVASYLEEEEGEKVLIVADGWDELGESERLEGSFIHKLLFQSFPLLSVVVTSRPSISAPLHRFPYIDRFVEVHGFNKENMKEYIESEFISDKEKADRLLEQLEYNPLVGSVCSVPLNCAIVCHLWRTLEEALPTTMTELYTKIVLNIILRNIHKVDMYNTVLSLPNFDALPGGLQRSWRLLCEFAYQALEKDHIVFSQRELDDFFPQGLGSILCFGLLQSAESIFETGCGVSFHFLHLSFQEYLAALHLVMQHQDTLVKIIQSHNSELAPLERTNFDISSLAKNANLNTKSKRFIMVWRFVFGILHVSQEWKKNNLDIKQVIKHLSDIRTHSYHSLLLCHCAFEARNITINKEVIHSLGKYSFITTGIMFSNATIIDFGHPQTAHDCAAVIYVISNMQECGCIVINFDNSGIRESQIRALTDVLASKHGKLQIKRIGLSGNKLTDKSVSDLFYRASAAFNSPDSINLSNNRIGVESIGSVVAKPYNRSLVLSHNPLGVHGLQKLEGAVCDGSLANLQELYLDGSLTSDADTNGKLLATFVEALLVHCPCLALLDLSQNNLGVPGASAFARGISQDKSHGSVTAGILHSMQICKINYILLSKTKLDLTAFVKSLVGPCHFWKLVLNDNDVRATGVSCLADGICSGKIVIERSMSEIYLHGNPLGLEGTVAIGRMISSSHCQLWGLSLSRCQLTTTGGGLPNTDSLNVDNNATIGKKVRDVGLQLCQMPQSSTITRLYLDDNSFTGEGVHILVGFMHLCPYLKQLSLHHCGITSDDLRQLLDQLTKLKSSSPYHCSKLESWDLSHNGIDDSGVSVLIDHLPLLFPRLTHLDCCAVDNNPVSSEMIRRLKEEMKRHQEVKCFVKSPPSPLPPPQDKDIVSCSNYFLLACCLNYTGSLLCFNEELFEQLT